MAAALAVRHRHERVFRRRARAGAVPVVDRRAQLAAEAEREEKKRLAKPCLICLSPPEGEQVVLCACGAEFCRPCVVQYLRAELCGRKLMHARPVRCPACGDATRSSSWAPLDFEAFDSYRKAAAASMSLQCGYCDDRRSLLPLEPVRLKPEARKALSWFDGVKEALREFARGVAGAERRLVAELGHMQRSDAVSASVKALCTVPAVAGSITDPERRAALLVAFHMQAEPSVQSVCCGVEHCFRCKVRDHHGSEADCQAYREANFAVPAGELEEEVRECPDCLSAIVRSEGCNSIACVCGCRFRFDEARVIFAPGARR